MHGSALTRAAHQSGLRFGTSRRGVAAWLSRPLGDSAIVQLRRLAGPMLLQARRMEPSARKLVGIALIGALILLWAAFVASFAPFVGKWPALVQAPYYLVMGVAWVIPLKPLMRWAQTGSFRPRQD